VEYRSYFGEDVCRVRLTAHGARSKEWLCNFGGDRLPAPVGLTARSWGFEGPRRFAQDSDPLLELEVHVDGQRATVEASLQHRQCRLTNEPPGPLREALSATGDLVRLASPEETVELAMRWFLAWDAVSGAAPTEMCFWFERTEATAFVATDLAAWLAAGGPVPLPAKLSGPVGAFFGVETNDDRQLIDAMNNGVLEKARHRLDAAYVGLFALARPAARVLLAVANSMPPGGDDDT
jgi:hypothetical protein